MKRFGKTLTGILLSAGLLLLPAAGIHAAPSDLNSGGGYLPSAIDTNVPAADPLLTPERASLLMEGRIDPSDALSREEALSSEKAFSDELPASFPASYTQTEAMRTYLTEQIMPTRDQHPFGSCWAQCTIAAMELYAVNKQGADPKTIDYSERHLVRYTLGDGTEQTISRQETGDVYSFNGRFLTAKECDELGITNPMSMSEDKKELYFLDRGGNCPDAAGALLRWKGAVAEEKAPYPDCAVDADTVTPQVTWNRELEYADGLRMENCMILNILQNPDLVKRYIREYGGVTCSYYMYKKGTNYNPETFAYYDPNRQSANHAVTIIGWDDNFPASRFTKTPPKNGAWLIRNSWVADSVDFSADTYFWLSYADRSLSSAVYVFTNQEKENYLDHNYYYDAVFHGQGYFSYNNNSNDSVANVFTVKGSRSELLKAVTLQLTNYSIPDLKDGGLPYEIRVYRHLSESAGPNQGLLACVQKGTLPLTGYFTLSLEEPVALNPGERFSVVVKLADGAIVPDVECTEGDRISVICGQVGLLKGQSYTSDDGGLTWSDWYEDNKNARYGNFCIGAQTLEILSLSASLKQTQGQDPALVINWDAPEGAQGYELRSSKTFTGPYESVYVTDDGNETSFSGDPSLIGDRYYKIYRRMGGRTDETSASLSYFVDSNGQIPMHTLSADDLSISLLQPSYVYDGKPHGVSFLLPEGYLGSLQIGYKKVAGPDESPITDAEITKDPPVDAGRYRVYVTAPPFGKLFGVSNLTDESWEFTITPRSLSSQDAAFVNTPDYVYDGKQKKPAISVTCNGAELESGKDYRIAYYDNIHASDTAAEDPQAECIPRCVITGTGNYSGEIILPFTIGKRMLTVTAAPAIKTAGSPDPAWQLSFDGMAEGEIPSYKGMVSREPGESPGSYKILPGTLTLCDRSEDGNVTFLASDYRLSFAGGTLTIREAFSLDPGKEQTKLSEPDEKTLQTLKQSGYTYLGEGQVSFTGTGDTKLKTLVIPSAVKAGGMSFTVTEIGDEAFMGNTSLKKIVIPKTVRRIGKKAFYRCGNLKDIRIKTRYLTKNRIEKKAFAGINETARFRIPKAKKRSYRTLLKKRGMTGSMKLSGVY